MRRQSDFFRQVSPPDELSSLSNGTPTGKSTDLKDKGEGSQMPNGDGARNIGRPSPDSPSLKSRNLDRSESYGRKPAEGFDGGYVHDSGSGSARVIPYDSGFANNSSSLRNASKDAIKALVRVARESTQERLSDALKSKSLNGTIYLGSVLLNETPVSLKLSVGHHKSGYTYNADRDLHEISISIKDHKTASLTDFKSKAVYELVEHIHNTLKQAASKNVPVDEKLWAEIQSLAKGESNKPVSRGKESVNLVNEGKGFETFPSAYANGWALAQYKRLGGKWKKESSVKQSSSRAITILNRLRSDVLKDLQRIESYTIQDNPHLDEESLRKEIRRVKKEWSKNGVSFFVQAEAKLKGLILNSIRQHLDVISSKTRKEQLMLKRLLPFNIFDVNKIIDNTGHQAFFNQGKIGELFSLFDDYIERLSQGRVLREKQFEKFIHEANKICQELGV